MNNTNRGMDKTGIMILQGFNDSLLKEMGQRGMLKGKALELYEKEKGEGESNNGE